MNDAAALPREIRVTDRALLWRREERDGKPTKVPYRPGQPDVHAAVNDPSSWGSFDAALANVQDGKADGVGLVLGDGIVGVDLDKCRDAETGGIEPWAREIVEALDSYTEVSPSGTGLHVLARGELPPGRRRKGRTEMYADGRYFTLTGERLDGTPRELHERTAELAELHARIFGTGPEPDRDQRPRTRPAPLPALPLDDRELIEKARAASNGGKFASLWAGDASGYDSASEADLALANLLAFWCRGDAERIDRLFRRSGLMRDKWAREDYRERTIGRALEGRTEFWEPERGERLDGEEPPEPEGEEEGGEPETEFGIRDLTHDGLALDLGDRWKDEARHVAAWGRWLFWNGSTWETDEELQHMTRSRQFLRELAEGLDADQGKAKKKLRSAHTVARVVGLARSNEAQAASVDMWDANPWLLGTPSGTLDLRTGRERTPRPEDYITKSTAVTPAPEGAEPPELFLDAIRTSMAGDEERVRYIQRAFGYTLTGLVREHVFNFWHGTGANGKTLILGGFQGALGDYACTIPTEMLMVSRDSRHPTELARLRGVRMAVGSETEQGRRWAESKIKALTGGDPIAARFMRQDFFEFEPQFKLFIIGNHQPSLRGVDEAMRRRLHLVPFEVTIPPEERDLKLPEKLEAEWPAILRWAIDGCLRWQREGLEPPASVQEATEEYLDTEDAISVWLEERVERDANKWEAAGTLYADWKDWAERAGEFVGSKKRLTRELKNHGFESRREPGTGTRGFQGLQVIEPPGADRWEP